MCKDLGFLDDIFFPTSNQSFTKGSIMKEGFFILLCTFFHRNEMLVSNFKIIYIYILHLLFEDDYIIFFSFIYFFYFLVRNKDFIVLKYEVQRRMSNPSKKYPIFYAKKDQKYG